MARAGTVRAVAPSAGTVRRASWRTPRAKCDDRGVNILLVTPWSIDATGGVSNVVSMLYGELEAAGHRVLAFVPNESAAIRAVNDRAGHTVFGAFLRSPAHQQRPLRAWVTFLLFLPATIVRLATFLREQRIDVVHVHYPLPAFAYFGWLRSWSRWRLVVTYHGNDAHDLDLWRPIERTLVRALLRAADCVTGVSPKLLEKVRSLLPGVEFAGAAIPNGAPVEQIARNAMRPPVPLPRDYVVAVGHLIKRKGVDLMLRALALLRSRGERLSLVLVGDGPDRAEFERLARELEVADDVHFLGSRSHDEAIAVVKGSTLLVLASRAEGFPLVLGEAMACRKTVVATAVDGVAELVLDGENGLVVPPDDPAALADALSRLQRDAPLRERLAEHGYRRIVAEYSWAAVARRYLEVYAPPSLKPAPLADGAPGN